MATRNFFIPGIDPDSVSPWPATQADMEVMFRQMYPATDLGMCIQQSSVPNVVTYTELATFLWLKTTTGELHYYDGAGWEKVRATTSIETSDVTGVLDAFTGLGASKVLRRNAANNAYEWVSAGSLFSTNSFPVANLANAAGTGYVLTSTTGGAWTTELFSALWSAQFGITELPIIQIYDVDGTTTSGQVLRSNGHTEAISSAWIEDLLRANTTATSKINWGGVANAGKYPKVNATGTDIEFAEASSASSSLALLVDTGAQNTAAQSITADTLTTVRLAAEGTLPSWITISSNAFTLSNGDYLVEAQVPIYESTGGSEGYVGLYTASTLLKNANWLNDGDVDFLYVPLTARVTPSASTTYTLKAYGTLAMTLGKPLNKTSIPEVYTQVKITKLA